MSDKSAIEWLDGGASWNPVNGCTPVAEGCKHCYARAFARRGMGSWKGRDFSEIVLHMDRLALPCGWRKPRRVLVCSMGDLFHEDVPFAFVNDVFVTISTSAPQHEYIVLTKRPGRARGFAEIWTSAFPMPRNLTLGVSCSTQADANLFVPLLLETPAAKRIASLEPLLEPVDLDGDVHSSSGWLRGWHCEGERDRHGDVVPVQVPNEHLDGVIVGGESGPKARPCDTAWIRSIIQQCQAAGVSVYVKQLGANPVRDGIAERDRIFRTITGKGADPTEWPADLRVREWHS